jgi:hypothetical protein
MGNNTLIMKNKITSVQIELFQFKDETECVKILNKIESDGYEIINVEFKVLAGIKTFSCTVFNRGLIINSQNGNISQNDKIMS